MIGLTLILLPFSPVLSLSFSQPDHFLHAHIAATRSYFPLVILRTSTQFFPRHHLADSLKSIPIYPKALKVYIRESARRGLIWGTFYYFLYFRVLFSFNLFTFILNRCSLIRALDKCFHHSFSSSSIIILSPRYTLLFLSIVYILNRLYVACGLNCHQLRRTFEPANGTR